MTQQRKVTAVKTSNYTKVGVIHCRSSCAPYGEHN